MKHLPIWVECRSRFVTEELRRARVSRAIGTYGGQIVIEPAAVIVSSQREPELSLAASVNMMSPIKPYRTSVPKGRGTLGHTLVPRQSIHRTPVRLG